MKVAVIRFPGANCDQDAYYSLRTDVGVGADFVWHEETSLAGFDAVFLPGGFAYGDYLRGGAIAARSPVMDEVRRLAGQGNPVIGACNGFQVLCEAGILPGALLRNAAEKFVCRMVTLRVETKKSFWTQGVDRIVRMPVAHGEGRYVCDDETLARLNEEGQVAFRYVPFDKNDLEYNVNGSTDDIAGIINSKGNVLGMMPHPERATRKILGSDDGLTILKALTLVRA